MSQCSQRGCSFIAIPCADCWNGASIMDMQTSLVGVRPERCHAACWRPPGGLFSSLPIRSCVKPFKYNAIHSICSLTVTRPVSLVAVLCWRVQQEAPSIRTGEDHD